LGHPLAKDSSSQSAHIMLITVWLVKSASNKSDYLFCSAPHAINGTERGLSFEVR